MAEHVPHHTFAPAISYVTSATVTAGRLVEATGDRTVGPAGATSLKVVGVAARDAVTGLGTPVFSNGVHDLVATGAIAAGDLLVAGAAGTVSTVPVVSAAPTTADGNNSRAIIGKALTAGVNAGTCQVLLKP